MKIYTINSQQQNFKSNKLHPIDLAYKKSLQKGLQDTFDIKCKIQDLTSIAGPIELRKILAKLEPKHYRPSDNFRANFHIHTIASDGKLTPKKFLEQCANWANKIFNDKKINDDLPAFSSAITDHDRIESVKETIAIISQESDKYKNFKFITGCEFLFHGYKEPHPAFEAIGLGFNPFDTKLIPMMQGFNSNNKIDDVKKILASGGVLSWAHPIISPDKLNDDFITFLKFHGINGIEGNYQYMSFDQDYINEGEKILAPLIKKHNLFITGGTDTHGDSIFKR